ncbi:hypothetical protein [Pleionea sp. CnH1-48]|uniref:hypothetical protein n=1 Tax=Pleionea sp. CnH1-48 TaxID=2954494 RepID=UPI002097EA82|nr:hypothetical protein [Pleionea sp. CnH1-48]MCO7226281.1 hypothetical protein [Pleionea sp. CnH1-48]
MLNRFFLVFCFFAVIVCQAQDAESSVTEPTEFIEGQDYLVLEPVAEEVPPLILVFWYGSESSYQVLHALSQWPQAESVTLWPAVFRESWRPLARLAMVAQELKLSNEQQLSIFEQVILSPQDWQRERQTELLVQLHGEQEAVETALRDSELPKRLKVIQKQLLKYPISHVPTIIFKGRYIINANQAQTAARLLQILEHISQQSSQSENEVGEASASEQHAPVETQ